jgi:hypothetical protein
MARKIDVPVGTRFGTWTTTSLKFKRHGEIHSSIRVKCDCGRESEIKAALLTSGRATRCWDCYNKGRPKMLSPEQVVINYVYAEYKKSAAKRGYTMYLPKEQLDGWIFSDCHYCGRPPQNILKDRSKNPRDLPKWNGIDRVDNTQGYDWHNIVTCCRWCNEAKKAKTIEEWDEWRKGLAQNYRVWDRSQTRRL